MGFLYIGKVLVAMLKAQGIRKCKPERSTTI
jgi:hypothetical protein